MGCNPNCRIKIIHHKTDYKHCNRMVRIRAKQAYERMLQKHVNTFRCEGIRKIDVASALFAGLGIGTECGWPFGILAFFLLMALFFIVFKGDRNID